MKFFPVGRSVHHVQQPNNHFRSILNGKQDDGAEDTLKREPMDENLEFLAASSESGGKRPATKEHFEELSKS